MATTVESAAAKLLDFSQPVDVPLLDATVAAFYGASAPPERAAAEAVLRQLQQHPEAWTRVDAILEKSSSQQSKYFALQVCAFNARHASLWHHNTQILEDVIKHRWGALPDDQREGIKNYISNLIIKLATASEAFRSEKVYLNKLNLILVEILKQDWPHKWPSFIPDIVGASRTSESLCENSMHILRMLSEEVFDFSRGELTQAKTRELKATLNNEFRLIHDLCLFVLNNSCSPDLVRATLSTLHAYLSWVPLGYIFESQVVHLLLTIFPQPPFRNLALQCLTEVAMLQVGPEFDVHFEKLYTGFVSQLRSVLPPDTDFSTAYTAGTDEDQALVQNLALFFAGFFRHHAGVLEKTEENRVQLIFGMDYLVNISFVPDDEVFKITLDYWNFLVPDVYSSVCTISTTNQIGRSMGSSDFGFVDPVTMTDRKTLYAGVLSNLRRLMIARMARPEEVIVVEDDNGNLIRETMKDTDTLARYKTMHETLVYLSHLDHNDTELQMLEKLREQMQTRDWSWSTLNTLCWAIGSISGSMQEEQENRFLISVIRDLLNLCEITRGKDNKAVVASNIMYVVGQYPRFLRNHWKFLKTVVNKLFEFMHETHPGVQDMACETFLKICHKCKRKFVVPQIGETEPFICELLTNLTTTIQDLEVHQIHMFYEAVGLMIGADTDPKRKEEYLDRLMGPPNTTWKQIIAEAQQQADILQQPEVVRNVLNILQTHVSVCSSLGPPFQRQMSLVYSEILTVYRLYSEIISTLIATGGPHAAKTSAVKLMRSVKKATLRLLDTFVEKHDDVVFLAMQFVPAMMDPILGDYARNVPDAREAEVLSVFATVINKLKEAMEAEVPRIFEACFECTLQMITKNFEDYPEHRLQFFSLLRAISNHCFNTLFQMNPAQLKLVIDSIVWAFRHTERNVAETGLNLLHEMLVSFQNSQYVTQFYATYYTQIMQEVFAVMTDTFHKPGFKTHCKILHLLCDVVQGPVLQGPIWDVAAKGPTAYPNNLAYVSEFVTTLLATSFPNLRPQQVQATVAGMFELKDFSAFKHHLRDFLVQTKQFASQDNADLFAEEVAQQREAERQRLSAIPGMLHPNELQEEMVDA